MKLCYERFLARMKTMYPEYKSYKGSHPPGSKVDNRAVMKRLKKEEAKYKDARRPMIQANAVNPTKLYLYTCNPELKVNGQKGIWRALTSKYSNGEWDYLLNRRTMTYGKPRYTPKLSTKYELINGKIEVVGESAIIDGNEYSGLWRKTWRI